MLPTLALTAAVNIYDVEAMQAGVGRLLAIAVFIGVAALVLDRLFPDDGRRNRKPPRK